MEQKETEPILLPIRDGWAAHGNGWAVHGYSQEEALQRFREAVRKHQEIDARPLWFEKSDAQTVAERRYR